jgi:hypothetical protein
MSFELENIKFDLPKHKSNVIKVIGIGGGGSNAVNYMYREGIKGVDFVICNTDRQALENSPVPNKIQLGLNLTEGLGAGANPDWRAGGLGVIRGVKRSFTAANQNGIHHCGYGRWDRNRCSPYYC